MSDAAITVVVTAVVAGVIQIVGMVIGFLTLWLKLKQDVQHAKDVALQAREAATTVERKLDENTATTEAMDKKTDTIVEQTNGGTVAMRNLVQELASRVGHLEEHVDVQNEEKLVILRELVNRVDALTSKQQGGSEGKR